METKTFNWRQLVQYVGGHIDSSTIKDLANLIIYARQAGIGKAVSFQLTAYTPEDILNIKKLVSWWGMLNINFSQEWRDKKTSVLIQKTLARAVADNSELQIYAVFCPSYKKGAGTYGYTGKTGPHTRRQIEEMSKFLLQSLEMGVKVSVTAFFSDLLLENYPRLVGTSYHEDLDNNYQDFQDQFKLYSGGLVKTQKLSSVDVLRTSIGEQGVISGEIGVPNNIYERVLQRNRVFYVQTLGWNENQVRERTLVLCRTYPVMGGAFRKMFPGGLMYWVESAYERGALYSGMEQDNPLPIIYPLKHAD